MAEESRGLEVEIGVTLNKLTRQLAAAETRMVKTASKMERDFNRSNTKAARSFEKIDKAVGRTGQNIDRIAGIVAGAFSVREIQRYADAWTVAGNKIAATSKVTGMQARSLSELNDLADETRAGVEETVDLYTKLMRATKGVAKSEEEVARATKIVNQAFKAGGAAASEQAAGILQLGQGLSSGILQGDELRSIRENAPLIAQAIADEFETTIGGLKDLGSEGATTADRVFRAILNAQDSIGAAFAVTNSTIGESFTRLQNAMIEFAGNADDAVGATEKIAAALSAMADNIDLVVAAGGILAGRFIGPVLLGMLVRAVPIIRSASVALLGINSAATASVAGLAALRGALALLGGPFGILIAGLTALPILMRDTGQTVAELEAATATGESALQAYATASAKVAEEQAKMGGAISAATQDMMNQSRAALQDSLRDIKKARDDLFGDLVGEGLFNRSDLQTAVNAIERELNRVVSAGDNNRFLSGIRDGLKEVEAGRGDIVKLARDMESVAGAGDEVVKAINQFDRISSIAGRSFDDLKQAAQPIEDIARQLGLFPDEIAAIEQAQTQADFEAAWMALREAMLQAAEAGDVIRSKGVEATRALVGGAADAQEEVNRLEAALSATGEALQRIAAGLNPFKTVEEGAKEAAAAVDNLSRVYDEYQRTRSHSDRVTFGRGATDAANKGLRDLIGFAEGTDKGRGYNETLGYGRFTGGDQDLVNMTLNEILELQKQMLAHPENTFNSSALGRYQIVSKTLRGLMGQMGLSGNELFTPDLQDQMADQLIAGRGRDVGGLRNEWEGLRRIDPNTILNAYDGSSEGLANDRQAVIDAETDALNRQGEARKSLMEQAQADLAQRELELSLIGQTTEAQVRARTEYQLLNEAKALGIDVDKELTESGATYRQQIEEIAAATGRLAAEEEARLATLDATKRKQEEVSESAKFWESQQKQLQDGIVDAIVEGKNLSDVFANLAKQIAKAALQAALFGQGPMSGGMGGGGGLLGGLFSGIFGGFKEHGGPVKKGVPYIVGEKRPELFVPSQNGTIVPRVPDMKGMKSPASAAPQVNVAPATPQVVIVDNPQKALDALNTPQGEAVIVDIMRRYA